MTTGTASAPLRAWICDTCGDLITDPTKGLVTWRKASNNTDYDFKIVHKSIRSDPEPYNCDPGAETGYIYHLDIEKLLGVDGLTLLLSWISVGPLKGGGGTITTSKDLDSYVDLVRRVQIPYYEEARHSFRMRIPNIGWAMPMNIIRICRTFFDEYSAGLWVISHVLLLPSRTPPL